MVSMRVRLIGLSMLILLACAPAEAASIYWTDHLGIHRANDNGSNPTTIVIAGASTTLAPKGIALDVAGGKMYWTDAIPSGLKIQRANLDGTGLETIINLSSAIPQGIAVDPVHGKVYFTTAGATGSGPLKTVERADLNGSNLEVLETDALDSGPADIALDVTNNLMYWSTRGGNSIQRAALDGGSVTRLVLGNITHGVAIDSDHAKLYWTNVGNGAIERSTLGGLSITTPLTAASPTSLGLDTSAGMMFWLDGTLNDPTQIMRANLDGGNPVSIMAGLQFGGGLALGPNLVSVPEPSAIALLASGALLCLAVARRRRARRSAPA